MFATSLVLRRGGQNLIFSVLISLNHTDVTQQTGPRKYRQYVLTESSIRLQSWTLSQDIGSFYQEENLQLFERRRMIYALETTHHQWWKVSTFTQVLYLSTIWVTYTVLYIILYTVYNIPLHFRGKYCTFYFTYLSVVVTSYNKIRFYITSTYNKD